MAQILRHENGHRVPPGDPLPDLRSEPHIGHGTAGRIVVAADFPLVCVIWLIDVIGQRRQPGTDWGLLGPPILG